MHLLKLALCAVSASAAAGRTYDRAERKKLGGLLKRFAAEAAPASPPPRTKSRKISSRPVGGAVRSLAPDAPVDALVEASAHPSGTTMPFFWPHRCERTPPALLTPQAPAAAKIG